MGGAEAEWRQGAAGGWEFERHSLSIQSLTAEVNTGFRAEGWGDWDAELAKMGATSSGFSNPS